MHGLKSAGSKQRYFHAKYTINKTVQSEKKDTISYMFELKLHKVK